jgi:CDP-diacylglycerol--glycerol-3-phosphate 3-phosphatidyltransferase
MAPGTAPPDVPPRRATEVDQMPLIGFRNVVKVIPNLLSFFRLGIAPVIVVLALSDERSWFVICLCVSFATDVLDGLTARAWNVCTDFGSRLDSIADELTYVAALVGIFQFEYQNLKPHITMLYVFIGLLTVATLVFVVKFGKTASFHLYSFKANALFQGIFFLILFIFGFNIYIYYFVMSFGILACIEFIAVTLVVNQPVSDAKSLYWVLHEGNRR